MAIALLAAAGEAGLLAFPSETVASAWTLICVHLMLSLVLALTSIREIRRAEGGGILAHVALWTFVAGPPGAVLAAVLVAFAPAEGEAPGRDFKPLHDASFEADPLARPRKLHRDLCDGRLRIAHAHRVVPLCEVMATGDRRAKFEALTVVGRRFEPGFAHVLHAAMKDPDPLVRVLASTVVAKLRAGWARELAALLAAVSLDPEDGGAWLALSQARDRYAATGLMRHAGSEAEDRGAEREVSRSRGANSGCDPAGRDRSGVHAEAEAMLS